MMSVDPPAWLAEQFAYGEAEEPRRYNPTPFLVGDLEFDLESKLGVGSVSTRSSILLDSITKKKKDRWISLSCAYLRPE